MVSYEADAYGAGTQNWMITQGDDLFVYAANNQGLLEFTGQQWTLYPSPNEAIIRSVYATDGRVYTGSHMSFGVWERDNEGALRYHSLTDTLGEKIWPDEQFWNIYPYEDYIVFQSLWQLFLYQPSRGVTSVITPPQGITRSFPTRQGLYFTNGKNGLFRLEEGRLSAVGPAGGSPFAIAHLWEAGDRLMVQSANAGTYRLEGKTLRKTTDHGFLVGKQIYSATSLRDGGLAFGTISDGVYVVAADGTLRYHLTRVNGLTNNTVLSLYQDRSDNLWAGTDNGISNLVLSSPFRKYTDVTGRLGTVHAATVHNGQLYLGTNQGLFTRAANQRTDDFRLVPGTRGQVWTLFQHDGHLFAGHDLGIFLVGGQTVDYLFSDAGTWTYLPVPGQPDKLLAGTYTGVWVLHKTAAGWRVSHRIEGFDYSARFLAMRGATELYISHEYRGVFGLRLSEDLRRVTERRDYDRPTKGKNAGLTAFGNDIYYASRAGFASLRDFDTGFLLDSALNARLDTTTYTSGKMTTLNDRLWFFTERDISYFHRGSLDDGLQREYVPVSAKQVNAKSGYENISRVGPDTLLIGTADGYLLLALASVRAQEHEIHLTRARATTGSGEVIRLSLAEHAELPYYDNNLSFDFSVPAFHKYFSPYFQYRLLGMTEEWSAWTTASSARFPGLPHGSYQLEVRSQVGRQLSENIATFGFTVRRPWYASYPALLLYLLAGGLLIYLLHRFSTRRYARRNAEWQRKREQQLTAERQRAELALTRLTNERLEEAIAAKNREMASSTMNLVRKNELLQRIKAELLAKGTPAANIKKVVRTIDQNIDEAETWNLFRDAFENADRDFFRKVKDRHPELTPNDLKLCAYLRLNLSSKEIAPMLNISVRSVEVKRYRLRKKMGLERETGLAEYILSL